MKTIIRNIIAVLAGAVLGSVVNMAVLVAGSHVIPPPPGVNVGDMESLRASMHLFEARHFLFPFLAHALGALIGGICASLLAATQRFKLAVGTSALFLVGGVINVFLLPAPIWFCVLDLVGAYLPMGWLAGLLAEKIRPATTSPRIQA